MDYACWYGLCGFHIYLGGGAWGLGESLVASLGHTSLVSTLTRAHPPLEVAREGKM